MTAANDYVDLVARERQKFLALDGVGPQTADRLVERYDTFSAAVDTLLTAPQAYPPEIGEARTNALRDTLQAAGYAPACECTHYSEVRYSQAREDVVSYCRACGAVIQATRSDTERTVRLALAASDPAPHGDTVAPEQVDLGAWSG